MGTGGKVMGAHAHTALGDEGWGVYPVLSGCEGREAASTV
jgi:hypothetical protein